MPWPSRKDIQKNASFFQDKRYCQVRVILEFAKFEMEAPSALSLNAMTYSDYKGHDTVKALFGCAPDALASF